MAHRRNKSYLSTCCQKNVTAISNREDDTWRRGAGGRKKERKYTTMCIFTSAHKHTRHAPTQIHRRDMELSSVDKQMTDKWHVGTPPPGLIVIALWDCANGISYGERGGAERESEACVSFYTNKTSAKHRMWLLPPLSTVSNLICLSIWVSGSEDMVKGGMMERWTGKEEEKRWICCIGRRICE